QQIEELSKKAATSAFSDSSQKAAIEQRIANLNQILNLEKLNSDVRLEALTNELNIIREQKKATADLAVEFVKSTEEQQASLIRGARLTDQFFGALQPQQLNTGVVTESIKTFLKQSNDDTRAAVIGNLERLKAAGGEIAPGVGAAEVLRQIADAVGGAILKNPEIDIAEQQRKLQERLVEEQIKQIEIAAVQLNVQTETLKVMQSLVISLAQKAVAGGVATGGTLTDVQRSGADAQKAIQASEKLVDSEQKRIRNLKLETKEVDAAAVTNKKLLEVFDNVDISTQETELSLEEFQNQMVDLRDKLITAEDNLASAQVNLTGAFGNLGDAVIEVQKAQAEYTIGLRLATRENIAAVGGFQTYIDEINFLSTAFDTQIKTLQRVGAGELALSDLRIKLAQETLSIIEQQLGAFRDNALRLFSGDLRASDVVKQAQAAQLVAQQVATAASPEELRDALAGFSEQTRKDALEGLQNAPPGFTFGGLSPDAITNAIANAFGGVTPTGASVESLQEEAARQRNIIAQNQITQIAQASQGLNSALLQVAAAQEALLEARAQHELAQLQLESLNRIDSTTQSLSAILANNIRGLPTPNAAGGTLTGSEARGLLTA
ncbi:MAG: hypothetical protein MN733_34030, partial [Nitrososphaera sp.]|nr:hypothetical protein [Nitrososphaera sp.]